MAEGPGSGRRPRSDVLVRGVGSPALFAIVYPTLAGSLYFSLGAVADQALGLTPLVFLAAAVYFVLCLMTYVEGASLHQERAGATVFARYAFNELVSFVAGWAILLDFVILIALATLSATNYLGAFWGAFATGTLEHVVAGALIVGVAVVNVVGPTARRIRRLIALTILDLGLQVLVIALGLWLVFEPGALAASV